MSDTKLENDASDSIGGIIYQFYIALDKCFELIEGESVFIEKDGDVSNHTEQIEVKNYSDALTDSHINFWNTTNNWLKPEFDHSKYKSLILLTTQDYGVRTLFKGWNDANSVERLSILNKIKDAALARYETAVAKTEKDPTEQKGKVKPDSLLLMEKILALEMTEKLEQIIGKIFIADSSPLPQAFYGRIKNQYLKGIPKHNKDIVMKASLGLIISPDVVESQFEIKEETFSKQFEEITAQYNSTTIVFPKKLINLKIDDSEKDKHLQETYVKKILEIEYAEAVPDAITHYVITNRTIAEELMCRVANKKVYEAYDLELINQIKPKYTTACRSATKETIINKSKDHYDAVMGLSSPALGTYNDTHIIFKNGTIHTLANDENNGITWKLKLENE
jgi:hypothetical protein